MKLTILRLEHFSAQDQIDLGKNLAGIFRRLIKRR
ncbi:putative acetyl transferase [Salmonella enterica subsp. arizonae]|nr:putative acetyl transferase [Salmonella enterica subsp. arizonae]